MSSRLIVCAIPAIFVYVSMVRVGSVSRESRIKAFSTVLLFGCWDWAISLKFVSVYLV